MATLSLLTVFAVSGSICMAMSAPPLSSSCAWATASFVFLMTTSETPTFVRL